MWFTLNKKNWRTGRVVKQVAKHVWCSSREHAMQLARTQFGVDGNWHEYGRGLSMFPYGQPDALYTLTCYGN